LLHDRGIEMSDNEGTTGSDTGTALQNIDSIVLSLEKANSLAKVLEFRDMATALVSFANATGADKAHSKALELKLRAERKAGQFLKDMRKNKGAAEKRTQGHVVPTLKERKIEPYESKRWQKMASIPDQKFEDYLAQTNKITQDALLHFAQKKVVDSESIEPIPRKAGNNQETAGQTSKEPKKPYNETNVFEEEEKAVPERTTTPLAGNNSHAMPTTPSQVVQVDKPRKEQSATSPSATDTSPLPLEKRLAKVESWLNSLIHDYRVVKATLETDSSFKPECPDCAIKMSSEEEGIPKCPKCGYEWF